jgi:hypothetical protein
VVDGLLNGAAYECEVATAGAGSEGPWEAAAMTVTPVGRPAAPGKPVVEPLDRAVRIQVPADSSGLVSEYRYECSSDQGGTWPIQVDVAASGIAATEIGGLTNGVEYVCRAIAANAVGTSDPSMTSDAVRPCGSLLECNPIAAPALGGLVALASIGILAALFMLYRERKRGYVVAVVDVVHSANLGNKSRMGIGFVRSGPRGPVTGIVADSSKRAEIRVRHLGSDRFQVVDRAGRSIALSGERVITIDSFGVRHEVVLRRFRTASASPVSRNA